MRSTCVPTGSTIAEDFPRMRRAALAGLVLVLLVPLSFYSTASGENR
jgi:hypothetical protein